MLFSRMVASRPPSFEYRRKSVIEITATGIDALTVSPTLSTRYSEDAPKIAPSSVPRINGSTVSSGRFDSGGMYDSNGGGSEGGAGCGGPTESARAMATGWAIIHDSLESRQMSDSTNGGCNTTRASGRGAARRPRRPRQIERSFKALREGKSPTHRLPPTEPWRAPPAWRHTC